MKLIVITIFIILIRYLTHLNMIYLMAMCLFMIQTLLWMACSHAFIDLHVVWTQYK